MTIRQTLAITCTIAALGVAAIQAAPAIADAMGHGTRAPALLTEEILTRHAEIDDLPAYMTDEDGHADY